MNKTVTVNLGGTVFHIDDNAYDALTKYLNSIKARFSAEQGRDEIMQDIESRIGEMFRDRMKDTRQVITLTDVEEVTQVMGKPEEFAGGDEAASDADSSASAGTADRYKKRMFRNPDDRLIGGVCSGIAAYFDVDPVWIRLGFAAFAILYGTGVWLYIILWIILPKAKTTADKLMMKGEPITISNIEKNVKEELEAVKQGLKDGSKPESFIRKVFGAIGEVFRFLFIAIGKIIAAFFILIGAVIAFALFTSLFGIAGAPFVHYPEFINHIFGSRAALGWTHLGVVLVVGIPFLMLAYAGARMLFNVKKGSRIVGFSALGLWLFGLFLLVTFGIKAAHEFSESDSIRKEVSLQQPADKYLILETNDRKNQEKDYNHPRASVKWDDDWNMIVENKNLVSSNVKLDIVKSPSDLFDVVEILYSHGTTRKEAVDNASRIIYSFTQADSVIRFDRHYTMNSAEKWRSQKVQLLLRVPVGGKIKLDNSLHRMIYDIDNVQNIFDNDMLDRTWQMTEKGLTCLDCTGEEKSIDHRIIIHGDGEDDVQIDEDGIRIKSKDGDSVIISKSGVHVSTKEKEVVKVNENGIQVNTDSLKTKKHKVIVK